MVEVCHLAAALDELLGAGGELTKNLLGMRVRPAGRWHQELLHRAEAAMRTAWPAVTVTAMATTPKRRRQTHPSSRIQTG